MELALTRGEAGGLTISLVLVVREYSLVLLPYLVLPSVFGEPESAALIPPGGKKQSNRSFRTHERKLFYCVVQNAFG